MSTALLPYSSPDSCAETRISEDGHTRSIVHYHIDRPIVSKECLDAGERIGDQDFLYRFLYMTDAKSTFLRYYFMLSMTFSLVVPIARFFVSDASPSFMRQLRDIAKPWHMTAEQWEHLASLHPDHVGPELNAVLNSIPLPPPIKTKRMVEDLYYFYMICFLPGYLEMFEPSSPVPDLRVRSYRCLYHFIHGQGIPEEENLRTHMEHMMMGAVRDRSTTLDRACEIQKVRIIGAVRATAPDAPDEMPSVNMEYETPESLAIFLAVSYKMYLPTHESAEREHEIQRDQTQKANAQIEQYVRRSGSRSRPQS